MLLAAEDATSGSAAADGGSANQTYYGCIVANNVLLSGNPVAVLDGAASPEACCRMCRSNSQCHLFQYCDCPAGCFFQYGPYAIELKHQQCEWAWSDPFVACLCPSRCCLARHRVGPVLALMHLVDALSHMCPLLHTLQASC